MPHGGLSDAFSITSLTAHAEGVTSGKHGQLCVVNDEQRVEDE